MVTAAPTYRFFIKVRLPGAKRFSFLTPRGGLIGLRVHAARFRDEAHAETTLAELRALNPDAEFKRVPIARSD